MTFTKAIFLSLVATLALPISAAPTDCKVFPSFNLVSQDADKAWHPVIGLEETKPLILTKSGVKTSSTGWMRSNPMTMVNDQFVEFIKTIPTEDEKGIKIWVQLKSSHALKGAFAVLTHRYHADDGKSWIACKQASIPDLTGKSQNFTVWFNNKGVRKGEWQLRIFHGGKELYDVARTDLKDASPKQSFNLQSFRRKASVGKGDAKPVPFYMPVGQVDPKLLPKGTDPYMLKVEVTIGAKGNIGSHKFVSKVKPALKKQVSANIKEWLFFPRIVQGEAVEQKVVIPLQLR